MSPHNSELSRRDPRLVWTRYCSFLDLPLADFMDIQEELLREQLHLIRDSPLGRRLLMGTFPETVHEFRSRIPLTNYGDYLPFLGPGNDSVLNEKPVEWAHTTGAQADFKWVPYTQRGLERLLDNLLAAFILAAANRRGEVKVWPGDTVLYNTPERPYVSGLATFGMQNRFGFRGVLDPELSEHLEFRDRVRQGFLKALGMKIDVIVAMTSVLVKVGEGFAQESKQRKSPRGNLTSRAIVRLVRAYLKSKLLRRQILPKDLWPAQAVLGWGVDTPFFRDKVEYYWGKPPFEMYACTEGGIMGMQSWLKEGLIFNPYSDFYEFVPIEESLRSREDDRYAPETLLLNEVEEGKTYEVIITNFYGMPFLRYRVGHIVEFIASAGKAKGAKMPQFIFHGRADDRIDLAGFTRLDEKSIWEALTLTGLRFEEWTVRKEFNAETPLLHMYMELKEERSQAEVHQLLHEKLKGVDPFYSDLESVLGIRPLRITLLPPATFERFYDARLQAGYNLGARRPPRMNATNDDIRDLLAVARSAPGG